jgi:hypothetical protein
MDEMENTVMFNAIRNRLMETHRSEFDDANEEAMDLCECILTALEEV